MKALRLPTILLALLAIALPVNGQEPDPKDCLVEVIVTYQAHDAYTPWQKRRPGTRVGYGVVVRDGQVITTENLVRNHTLVELRRAATGEKIPATVETSDYQVNLALLRIDDPRGAAGLKPLDLAKNDITRETKTTILQFDETRQIQRGEAEVVQINVAELPSAPYSSLTFNLLTDLNVKREGAAVVRDGRLCGIMMGYNRGERIGYMLPYSVLRRFIDDVATPPYAGVPTAGFRWKALVDPAKRAYLGLEQNGIGVLVLSCIPETGADEVLEPNDVVVEWAGHTVDNLGFYDDAEYGRMSLSYLVRGRGTPGKHVPVKVMRDGKPLDVKLFLANLGDRAALIPENIDGRRAEYLVEGGLILREVCGHYLRARGGDWKSKTDIRITNTYLTRRNRPEKPGDRVVVLAGVLPDDINIGYQSMRDQIIEAINGQPVRNMADVFRIKDADGVVERVKLRTMGVELVLDRETLPVANKRLAQLYRLPSLRYQVPGETR
jgi:S1-C subfamily serine protease